MNRPKSRVIAGNDKVQDEYKIKIKLIILASSINIGMQQEARPRYNIKTQPQGEATRWQQTRID